MNMLKYQQSKFNKNTKEKTYKDNNRLMKTDNNKILTIISKCLEGFNFV